MKCYVACLCICLLICGCVKKNHLEPPTTDDFESLTGKALPTWQYVQTQEDKSYLSLYKKIYEFRKLLLPRPLERIPKKIHFIWLGPQPFPRASVENVRTWIGKHPGWTVYFWTDRARPLPCPEMQMRYIQDLPMTYVQECVAKSDNYAEKSDLLRCDILYQEGGIYVDHDVKCFRAFDPLHHTYDFYCGIDMPATSSLPSCIYTTNNLIGAKPHHPIVLRCMELVQAQWDQIQSEYPGTDRDDVLNRVLHRTFWLFGEAVKQKNNEGDNQDIVFPAYYFDAPHDSLALYARHQYAGTWHQTETPFEKMVRERLVCLSKKSNRTLLIFSVVSALNLVAITALFVFIRKKVVR